MSLVHVFYHLGLLLWLLIPVSSTSMYMTNLYSASQFASSLTVDPHIILFFSPRCPHSQAFFKTWVEFISLRKLSAEVKSALVDCSSETDLCITQNILAYPTIKFYHPSHLTQPVRFKGDRTVERLKRFLFDMVAKAFEEINKPPDSFPAPQHFRTVVELNDENFEKITTYGSFFVKFYTAWCPVCQDLAPKWADLAQQMPDPTTYSIAEMDCDKSATACSTHRISEYPTLLWYHNGRMTQRYKGSFDLTEMQQFVDKSLSLDDEFKHITTGAVPNWMTPVSSIEIQTDTQFQELVKQHSLVFVKFYVPWCRYCKELAPKWTEMSEILARDHPGKVSVLGVDCEINKKLCAVVKVRSYPSLVLYRDGRAVELFRGPRDSSALVNFVLRHIEAKNTDKVEL